MTSSESPALVRMQALIRQWQALADPKATFLTCYAMMTQNMLAAIARRQFDDPPWVDRLLNDFADYYFVALAAYQQNPAAAPPVWQVAHTAASDPDTTPLQKLLLGVNAHINYDLVLTLADLLRPEWQQLPADRRESRYRDYCGVNDIIGSTINAVQDQILEPAMPVMALIDKLLGPLDERLISRLITHWREQVWLHALQLLESGDSHAQSRIILQVETEALKIGELISLRDLTPWRAARPPA